MPDSPAVPTRSRARRALVVVAIVLASLLISAVAVRAGFWQLGRHEARATAIALFDENSQLAPVAASEAASDGSLADDEWRRITATGTFDTASLTLLRNRPIDRERVYQLLVWLDTDDGRSLLVNLGYVPVPGPTEDLAAPALPDGSVTVTAVARAFEADDGRRDSGATRIVPTQVPAPAGDPYDAYAVLREACADDGCVDHYGAGQVPLPELSLGPHLAYTWQWFAFAVIAPVGGVLLARREWTLSGDGAPVATASRVRRAPRRRSGPSDEEIEDALQGPDGIA
ncbi:SURF1 family protein [Demequina sp. SYSU T00039]|uniref:SURF1-like protein n=1 Tax=Demequina lignilytica TaxID=3051663 RepID=A0AAW7M5L8_9MICO|nr:MULTISPECIES: SURF1 family protein [unclassified Demequina]MDN4479071.1 SURF1 family protein [Demequina sp. SYSU T00039-1]MDN4489010.1 SURF1 family protein [Demequina sp. SYSU T00039]